MENLNIHKLTGLLRKNSKNIFTFTAVGLAVGIIYAGLIYKPVFSSTSKLMITDEDRITISDNSNSKVYATSNKFSNPVLTQLEIVNSNDLALKVWQDVSKKHELKIPDEKGINLMKGALKTATPPGTDIVSISAKWTNPDIAKDIAQSYADKYTQFNLDTAREGLVNTKKTIAEELKEAENRLAEARQNIKEFKIQNQTVDVDVESATLVNQISELENKFIEVSSGVSRESGKAGALSGRLGMGWKKSLDAVALGHNSNFTELVNKYNSSKEERASFSKRYTPANPKMAQLEAQLGQMQEDLKEQVRLTTGNEGEVKSIIADPVRTHIVQSLADSSSSSSGLSAESRKLKSALNALKERSAKLPEKQYALAKLMQEEANWANIVNALKEKQIEADVRIAEVKGNLNLIQNAMVPISSEFPGRLPLALMFAMFGSLLALANGVFSYLINDTYDEAEEIENAVNSPVLGIIPWLEKQIYNESGTNISVDENASFYTLAYQKLISAIKIRGYRSGVKSLAFTSTDFSKTRSAILMNIAKGLSKSGQNVILLDADFRTPSLHKEGNVSNSNKSNLRELLMDATRSIQSTGGYDWNNSVNYIQKSGHSERLHIITNGGQVSEPSEFLHSKAFSELLSHLRGLYDWVLIDMPPVAAVPDSITASMAYDGLILMTGIETTKATIRKVSKMIDNYKTPLFGVICREKQEEEAITTNKYIKQIISAMMPNDDEKPETTN